MCDCYDLKCKCGMFYVGIHITDFDYPRDIIDQVYCPFCNYRGPRLAKIEKVIKKRKTLWFIETNKDGEFAIDNWLFHSGISRGEEGIREEIYSIREKPRKKVRGYFAIKFNKKHKDYVSAQKFMDEDVGFNGNPNDVENLVPECYRYKCKNIIKKRKWDKFLKEYYTVDVCRKYKREIWRLAQHLKQNCKFLRSSRRRVNE